MAQQPSKWSHWHNRSGHFQEWEKTSRCTGGTITGPKHFPMTSYRSYSTNIYKQNHGSATFKLLGTTAQTQILLPPETTRTLYKYMYLEIAQNMVPDIMGRKIKIRKHPTHGTQCVIEYTINRNSARSLQENSITVFGPRLCNSLTKYLWDIESVETEKFKFEFDKFLELIPHETKMPNVTVARSNSMLDELSYRKEGPRNLQQRWSLRLGLGAGLTAPETLQIFPVSKLTVHQQPTICVIYYERSLFISSSGSTNSLCASVLWKRRRFTGNS